MGWQYVSTKYNQCFKQIFDLAIENKGRRDRRWSRDREETLGSSKDLLPNNDCSCQDQAVVFLKSRRKKTARSSEA